MMGPKFNERTWLTWIVKVRIIIITFLLGIELTVTSFIPTAVSKWLFISVIVLWYTIAVFHALLLHAWDDARIQARLQVITDLIFATAILYVTGGTDTSFNFLYPLLIITAAMLLPPYWAYLTAALSFIGFGAVLELTYFEFIRSYSLTRPDLRSLQATILVNFFAYMAIAYLASQLMSKLRKVDVQLQEKSGALQDLQALHGSIINSMTGGLVTTTLDGRIRLVNPAGEFLLARASEELVGLPVNELFKDPLPPVEDGGLSCEARMLTPSGVEKIFRVTGSVLTVPERGAVGHVYTLDDLTQIRRLEGEVRMRDRMSAIGRMAAAIAHEIRNPLSSIAGSVNMLGEIAALDDEQKMLLEIVKRESERLNAIITGFLDYSRGREYHIATLDLLPLLEDTLTLLSNRPELTPSTDAAPRVQIVRDFEVPQAWAEVDGDRIKQVFWNICDNAVRAMPDGGTLRVALRVAGQHWRIIFADSGAGLSPQLFDKIFEPFQSAFHRGTGLGLAIVYDIVQAHEGRISVQSAPGKGTEFTLELRRAMHAPEAQSAVMAGAGR